MALTKVTNDLLALGESTEALGLPKGTTAQRPSSPVQGMTRQNTDDDVIEYYNGTEWKQLITVGPPSIDYLLIAGGGGGGGAKGGNAPTWAAGGGGGGYKTGTDIIISKSAQYTILVGAGGVGGVGQGTSISTDGLNSQISGLNITTTIAYGGIGGGKTAGAPGGDSGFLPSNFGGTSSPNQSWGCGGGGGIGFAGINGTTSKAGNGGDGLPFSTSGSAVYYGGGGGGGIYQQISSFGAGGLGGGGDGKGTNANGQNGADGLGGGGGGAGATGGAGSADYSGGSGGAGIVILKILTSNYSGTTTGAPAVTTDGAYTILTYTSSGTYTA